MKKFSLKDFYFDENGRFYSEKEWFIKFGKNKINQKTHNSKKEANAQKDDENISIKSLFISLFMSYIYIFISVYLFFLALKYFFWTTLIIIFIIFIIFK